MTPKCINLCLIDISQVILKLIWGYLIKPSIYCQSFKEMNLKETNEFKLLRKLTYVTCSVIYNDTYQRYNEMTRHNISVRKTNIDLIIPIILSIYSFSRR